MEGRKKTCEKRTEAHNSSSTSDSDSLSDVRSQIEKLSLASGSDDPREQFTGINGSRKKDSTKNRKLSRRQRNLDLYDDDYCKDSSKDSLYFDEFVEDHEIIADIRSINGGLNYSNKKLERLWGAQGTFVTDDSPSLLPDESKEWPELTKEAQLERKKCRRNVAVASLLEKRERKTRHSDEAEKETEMKNSSIDENMDPNPVCHFIQDPIETDFFYRETKVSNSDIDFTVPHVGQVTVIKPRKFHIENFNDEDIAFCRKPQRANNEKSSS